MKTITALVVFGVLVAFLWRLTERLQDDALAMLLGFGAGIVILLIVLGAMLAGRRMENMDRANERRHASSCDRGGGQPPVIIIQAGRQIEERTSGYLEDRGW